MHRTPATPGRRRGRTLAWLAAWIVCAGGIADRGVIAQGGDSARLEALVAQLDHDASSKRREAVRALQEAGAPSIPFLVPALADPRERVRFGAAQALGRIGAEAVPAIEDALGGDEARVREAAAMAAGFAGDTAQDLLRPLLRALHDPSDRVQVRAAAALLRVRPGAGAAIDTLAGCLASPRRSVRLLAADALGNQGHKARAAAPALRAALDTNDPQTRLVAAEALAAMDRENEAVLDAALSLIRVRAGVLSAAGGRSGVTGSAGGDAREEDAAGEETGAEEAGANEREGDLEDDEPEGEAGLSISFPEDPEEQADWIRFRARRLLSRAGPTALPKVVPLLRDREAAVREAGRKAVLAAAKSSRGELLKLWEDASLPDALRRDVARILAREGKPAMALFLEALRGKDLVARRVAAEMLGQIEGDPPAAVRALLEAMSDADTGVRAQAAASLALRAAGSKELAEKILPHLRKIVLDPKEPARVRQAALGALAAGDPEFLPLVVSLLGDRSMRSGAAAWSARLGPKAIPSLREVLRGADAEARLGAVEALQRMGSGAGLAVEDLLDRVRDDPDLAVAAAAARAIGWIGAGDPKALAPESIESLETLLEAKNDATRIWIADALSRIHGSIHPALVEGLRSEDAGVRNAVSRALSSGPVNAASVRALMLVVKDPDPEIRERAVSALVHAPAAGLRIFRVLLSDPDATVREASVRGLGSIGGYAGKVLATVIHTAEDPDPRVRSAALDAMGRIAPGESRTLLALAAALHDPDPTVRRAAASAFGWLRPASFPAAAEALAPSLRGVLDPSAAPFEEMDPMPPPIVLALAVLARGDEDAGVRAWAAGRLRSLGPAAAIAAPALREAAPAAEVTAPALRGAAPAPEVTAPALREPEAGG